MTMGNGESKTTIVRRLLEKLKSIRHENKKSTAAAGIEQERNRLASYAVEPDPGPDFLYELREARERDGDVPVRWFTNNYFDLALWLDPSDGHILGFQLCYDRLHDPHALTWKEASGYFHHRVDDGENPGRFKMSPLLVSDGIFSKDRIVKKFEAESVHLDPGIRAFVQEKIEHCAI